MFSPRLQFPQYRTTLAHFKGHQQKAINHFDKLRSQIHLIVHLKDARAPVATSYSSSWFKSVPTLTVYSNGDRSDFTPAEGEITLDARGSMSKVFKSLIKFHATLWPPPPLGLRMMVCGVPNIGKSTMINSMRAATLNKRKVARTGLQAGTTRATSEIVKIHASPDMYVYDTPGVMEPHVDRLESLLQLYLIGSVMPSTNLVGGVDPIIAADYLLYIMNLLGPNRYTRPLKMEHPSNAIEDVLDVIGRKYRMFKTDGQTDKVGASLHMVEMYRKGVFGQMNLDDTLAMRKFQRRISR